MRSIKQIKVLLLYIYLPDHHPNIASDVKDTYHRKNNWGKSYNGNCYALFTSGNYYVIISPFNLPKNKN